jgi:subtilisin family serine protease
LLVGARRCRLPRAALVVVGACVAALIAAPATPVGAAASARTELARVLERRIGATWPDDAVAGALLVTTTEAGALHRALRSLSSADAAVRPVAAGVSELRVAPGTEAAVAARLAEVDGVVAVEPDRLRRFALAPDDPDYPRQWAHQQTGIEQAWEAVAQRIGAVGSRGVRLAVVDSGVRGDHADLRANVAEQVDAAAHPVVAVGAGVDNDTCGLGHGTFVAGIAAGSGDNGRGVAGATWSVSLLDVAVSSQRNPESCDPLGGVPDSAILRGLDHAVARGAHVVNLSLGGFANACPTAYQTAVDAARAAGVVVVAAAGNGEQRAATKGLPSVPASCNGVIAVGATTRTGGVAGYSSANRWVDLVAPGGSATDAAGCSASALAPDCLLSTDRSGGVSAGQGTSFAAAYVSGAAALVRAVRPDLTPDQVEAVLERDARDLEPAGRDASSGWGALRADAALATALSGDPVRGPEPDPAFPVSDDASVEPPADSPTVTRITAGSGATAPIPQAVAVSQAVFAPGAAAHVVLARDDDYPDALAGSSLGFGVGPLLFTRAGESLDARTRDEIRRVLPPGGTVYLLGGTAVVPSAVDAELRHLGYQPLRLAGASREETAAQVARELRRRLRVLEADVPSVAILVTRRDWPDAVSAGALGAYFGVPILLTGADDLHPATADVLRELDPAFLYVVGGRGAVSDAVVAQARRVTGADALRLGGGSRDATAVAVAREVEAIFGRAGTQPRLALAANVSRDDGYAHALSASALAGVYSALYVPVLGNGGTVLTDVTVDYVRGLRIDAVLAGDVDVVAPTTGERLEALLSQ